MLDDYPCEDCGAEAEQECDSNCTTNQPTDDELAQDWIDVGSL